MKGGASNVRVVALGLLLALAGCTPKPVPAVSVQVGDETVAAYRDSSAKEVQMVSSGPGRTDVSTSFKYTDPPAVHMSRFDHGDAGIHDTYLYGVAPAGSARVETSPIAAGQSFALDGTFLAVIQSPDSSIDVFTIHWTFLSGAGTVLAEGDGPNQPHVGVE